MKTIEIAGRSIGSGCPCFLIAEAGVNHNGDLDVAFQLVDAASKAGADAVKFQTFSADRLVTRDAPKADYQKQHTSADESQYEMLKKLELSESDHRALLAFCQSRRILFLSTPFDEESADFLDELGVAAFKVSSGDLTCHPLLERLAAKGRPVILSTGMADMAEVGEAVRCIERAGPVPLALLHCVSCYPAPADECNLRAMRAMEDRFARPVGFSDHTAGSAVAFAAVALGACIVEKHITLDRSLPGPDHTASFEPAEFAEYGRGLRAVESALGNGEKQAQPSEINAREVARKSLVASRPIAAGSVLRAQDMCWSRPGTGLPPSDLSRILGRRAACAIAAGAVLRESMLVRI